MRKVIEWAGAPGFNGRNFAAYQSRKNGRAVMWKDEWGKDSPDGPVVASPRVVITDEEGAPGFQPRAQEIISYIEGHPYVLNGEFRIRDLDAEEEARMSAVKSKGKILAAYYSLSESELRKVMTIGGLDSSGDILDLHGRIQMIVDSGEPGIKKLHKIMATQDKEYRLVLKFAIDSGLMHYSNNRYRIGGQHGEVIGFEEDAVIRWMKDNQSEYKFLLEGTEQLRVSKGIKDSAPIDVKDGHKNHKSERITSAEEAMQNISFEDEVNDIPTGPKRPQKSYAEEEAEMSDEDMLAAASGLKANSFKSFSDPNLKKD